MIHHCLTICGVNLFSTAQGMWNGLEFVVTSCSKWFNRLFLGHIKLIFCRKKIISHVILPGKPSSVICFYIVGLCQLLIW